jgi:hypothetical protein
MAKSYTHGTFFPSSYIADTKLLSSKSLLVSFRISHPDTPLNYYAMTLILDSYYIFMGLLEPLDQATEFPIIVRYLQGSQAKYMF